MAVTTSGFKFATNCYILVNKVHGSKMFDYFTQVTGERLLDRNTSKYS